MNFNRRRAKFMLYVVTPISLLIMAIGWVFGQHIPGHEIIEYSLTTTYIGPRDAIRFDTKYIQDSMRAFPSIYCEGDFKFQAVVDNDKRIEVICTYDWAPDGAAGH